MTDFDKLSNAALHGDLETIRTMVAVGFDLSALYKNNSVLTRVLFEDYTQGLAHCYDVVKLLLELGANLACRTQTFYI
jgi:hypothetical protein